MNRPGFTSAENFACTLAFGAFLSRFAPTLVMLCLLTPLILHGLLGLGWPLVLVLTAAAAVALTARKKRQFDRTWGTAELELSPEGATVADRHSRVHLPWDRIHHLGKADLIDLRYRSFSARPAVMLLTAITALAARRPRRPALIGLATTTVAPGTPMLVREQIRQNNGCRDIDRETGNRLTAIVLTVYDQNWEQGRIGEWIRAYRPDLLPRR
jgi:hypothetical protein